MVRRLFILLLAVCTTPVIAAGAKPKVYFTNLTPMEVTAVFELRRELASRGLELTSRVAEADYIVTQSTEPARLSPRAEATAVIVPGTVARTESSVSHNPPRTLVFSGSEARTRTMDRAVISMQPRGAGAAVVLYDGFPSPFALDQALDRLTAVTR